MGLLLSVTMVLSMSACGKQAALRATEVKSEALVTGRIDPTSGLGQGNPSPTATVQEAPLPFWDLLTNDFESEMKDDWGKVSEKDLGLIKEKGVERSTGLVVNVNGGESYVTKTESKKNDEGYLSFWFNPDQLEIGDPLDVSIPWKSVRIADIKGSDIYEIIVGIRIWKPYVPGDKYMGYLEWKDEKGAHFDFEEGQFELVAGWQKITLGYHINDWVAIWIDDELVRRVNEVHNIESFGDIVELGKTNNDMSVLPSGMMIYDNVAFRVPMISDLWVDQENGNDEASGKERDKALATIQGAANLAGPGTKVHILPGIYRETIHPVLDGSTSNPVVYVAEEGADTVLIRGSENSRTLEWQTLEENTIGLPADADLSKIFVADLSSWELDSIPRFVVEVDSAGDVKQRFPLAREPDWQVVTPWKVHEFWWSADGGSQKAACSPEKNLNRDCDLESRSMTELTDVTSDNEATGIEAGNLSTLGDLTGATLVALDTVEGHYVYRRTIVAHDIPAGRITVDRQCEFDTGSQKGGLGWGTRYYVEGKAALLDTPGEWWYDTLNKKLYLWSAEGDPGKLNIEISRFENGFILSDRSNVTIDGLTLEFFNGSAIYGYNEKDQKSFGNTIRNTKLFYANYGILLTQNVGDDPENITSHFVLESSEIAEMDTNAVKTTFTWRNESKAASFRFAGITDTEIRGNELHDLGFRSDSDNANGVSILYADKLRFEGNHIHDVAHNGVQISYSVMQSPNQYAVRPEEIKTGGILINDNLFEKACEMTSDCAGLKFWGDTPDMHIYRDVLITGNVFRDTFGWSSISEIRHRWEGGSGSTVKGLGGFGLYIDMASGFHIYRNIACNNAFAGFYAGGVWRDGEMIFYNNISANSLYGFFMSGLEMDTHANVNTQIVNNIMVNNEAQAIWFTDSGKYPGGVSIDYNLYENNGWRSVLAGGVLQPGILIIRRGEHTYRAYQTLNDIQKTTGWDTHSLVGNVPFEKFDLKNHDIFSAPPFDFHMIDRSDLVTDRGSVTLPESLIFLLDEFNIPDVKTGNAYEIGRYEFIE